MKSTIITGADATYFELLLDLVHSIRACPESAGIDLCVLNVGLTPEQAAQLAPLVTRTLEVEWEFDFSLRSQCPPWYKAMFMRPFFPKYFPEYDTLLWIDADAWVCNWNAITLLLRAAELYGVAIVPELDRAYSHCYHLRPEVFEHLRETYQKAFGPEAAKVFPPLPVLNCGVFAMRREGPHWEIWRKLLVDATQRGVNALIEQCAFNVGVYTGKIAAHFLPSWCNWNVAHAIPLFDPASRRLLAPMLPHEEICICHLIDVKNRPLNVRLTDGSVRQMPLTYRSVRLA